VRVTTRGQRPAAAVLVAALVAVLALVVLSPAQADDKKAIDAKVKAAQSQLENATRQVQAAAAALVAAQAGLPSAQQALSQASTELASAQAAEAEVTQRLAAAEAERAKAERAVAAVQERMAGTRQLIGRVARDVYTSGSAFTEWQVVLQSESPDDLVARIAGVQSVMRSQGSALDRLAQDRADLAEEQRAAGAAEDLVKQERAAAQARTAEVAAAAEAARQAKAQVDALVSQRDSALASAESERAGELKRLQELQAEQKRVAAAIAAASRRSAGSGKPTGALIWPTAGSTSGQVGPRTHPVYGYRSCHTGIDIGAPSGQPIKAAAAGTVVSASSNAAYGNMTIISHSGGLATMYAHQSRFGARAGQTVKQGQVIGYVGSTGYSSGPHLHFEVHVNGTPYNPMGWFGGAKTPIRC
jgi:murein DD-endopeptidase MepM/ murein hydrolase activator NlpD